MADILKISTPLVEKMPVQAARPTADPSMPFNLSDVTRVAHPSDTSQLLQQNTGMIAGDARPKILENLLKDPSVTASTIRNIYVLQEIIRLLPANNTALTKEIQQLFDMLLLRPEDLAGELGRQEQNTTLFKGEVFDMLRGLLAQNANRPEVVNGIGVLLKGLNATLTQRDALDSVSNNLAFLSESLSSSSRLSEKLNELVLAFRAPDAIENFTENKAQVLSVLKEIEASVLFSPKLEKILPLVIYNLSRYNDNADFLPGALSYLLNNLDASADKAGLVTKLQDFLDKFTLSVMGRSAQPDAPPAGTPSEVALAMSAEANASALAGPAQGQADTGSSVADALSLLAQNEATATLATTATGHAASLMQAEQAQSRVMDALSKLLGKSAENEDLTLLSGDKVEKIVHSLLSSPSNFTPLLHFVLPVEQNGLHAFAEIWIDPNAEAETGARNTGGTADNLHMLLVFDVESLGRFEAELYVQDKRIAMNLMCPPAYTETFKGITSSIRQVVSNIGYGFETIKVSSLERTHSLMDVFTDLPHRRTGIDVKI